MPKAPYNEHEQNLIKAARKNDEDAIKEMYNDKEIYKDLSAESILEAAKITTDPQLHLNLAISINLIPGTHLYNAYFGRNNKQQSRSPCA
jgi:hypothetical protein